MGHATIAIRGGTAHAKVVGMTYDVNGHGFDSFMAAVAFAKPIRAHVVEVASGIIRWEPAAELKRTRHVLVQADGSKVEFSKVRR